MKNVYFINEIINETEMEMEMDLLVLVLRIILFYIRGSGGFFVRI